MNVDSVTIPMIRVLIKQKKQDCRNAGDKAGVKHYTIGSTYKSKAELLEILGMSNAVVVQPHSETKSVANPKVQPQATKAAVQTPSGDEELRKAKYPYFKPLSEGRRNKLINSIIDDTLTKAESDYLTSGSETEMHVLSDALGTRSRLLEKNGQMTPAIYSLIDSTQYLIRLVYGTAH